MEKKRELEYALGARIHDEHVDFIKQYYRAFYDEPARYKGDKLVDMILSDINVTPVKDPIAAASMIDGMVLKHRDTLGSLAWGSYKDHPVYMMVTDNVLTSSFETGRTDMQLGSLPTDSELLVGTVAIADDKSNAVVFVQSVKDIREIGELPFTICSIPGYTKAFMSRLFIEGQRTLLEDYYVPFVNVGTGRNPVLWKSHVSTDEDTNRDMDLLDNVFGKLNLYDGVYQDDFKRVRLNLENKYPGINLEYQAEQRYVTLKGATGWLVFNQNAVPGKSNIHTQEMLVPWAVDIFEHCPDYETNLVDILEGNAEWADFYFKIPGQGEVSHKERTTGPNAEQASSGATIGGRELGKSNATSRLGKLLDNASGSYEQQKVD